MTIQNKIWGLVSLAVLIMGGIWIALMYSNQQSQEQYSSILSRYLQMNEVTTASQSLVTELNEYIRFPVPAQEEKLAREEQQLREIQEQVRQFRTEDNQLDMTNYLLMMDSLIEASNRTLSFVKQSEADAVTQEFNEANRIAAALESRTLYILDQELRTYNQIYRDLIQQSKELERLGLWLLGLITAIVLLVAYRFSLSITKPVHELTRAANEVAKGNFTTPIHSSSNDEIAFLAKTFDTMRENINELFQDTQEKARLENELQENQLLLKESQLKSLQSQINPHFLFNTLNTLSKKAYLDGAEETSDLLVSVAGLLRYSLKKVDQSVTLKEEVTVIDQYIAIQTARFADRLTFHKEIDPTCMQVQLPSLTLQPIVENAMIHGIERLVDGGTIVLRVFKQHDAVIAEVKDDGPGISEIDIEHLLHQEVRQETGHSTSIGFQNVRKRLQLFYGTQDVMTIESSPATGTTVRIRIPLEVTP
ncbi:HAMP domain-containing protein [Chryseomicrobium aureum]|uniref:sensor histidine kinase n=1 Tax=Chryseomicrobium aureum TaxID=1441723 RepID=UPI00195ADF7E|nr:sensor histidine kinase [Chryseomicrobium aureum]MBM7707152.1 HAMP domain-containing protein [Chryseomicrobium aureum]